MTNELLNAFKFLRALPKTIPIPIISNNDDYSVISMEWHFGKGTRSALIIFMDDEDGQPEVLGYAYLINDRFKGGEVDVTDPTKVPEDFVQYIYDSLELYDYDI